LSIDMSLYFKCCKMSIVPHMLHGVLASQSLICYLAAPRTCALPGSKFNPPMSIDVKELPSLRNAVGQRHPEMVSLISQLVEIESPSGDVEGSRAVNDQLENIAEMIPSVSSVDRIISPNCGEHFLIRAFDRNGHGDDKATLILGHTDTVHPRGTLAAHGAPRIAEGRLYGPGVFDMKASCVVALESLRALTTFAQPRRPVRLLLTCDEETGSATGRALVEREAANAAYVLVLEPPLPGGSAKTSRKGVGQWKVAAQGIAAHAGLDPKAGASAILELARQTERLHSLNDSSGVSFNVGVIRGGTRGNVVAAQAEMEVDARFSTIDEARRVAELISSLKSFDKRVSLTITGGINRAPLERTAAVASLFRHAQAIASQVGFTLGECSAGGASDGNFAAALNVPVLDGLGVDGDGAHAAHEHILLSDIVPRTTLLTGLLATL
jgi:glutamate carboxypeptidase